MSGSPYYRADELAQRASSVKYEIPVAPEPAAEQMSVEQVDPRPVVSPEIIVNVPSEAITVQLEQPKTMAKVVKVIRDRDGRISDLVIEPHELR